MAESNKPAKKRLKNLTVLTAVMCQSTRVERTDQPRPATSLDPQYWREPEKFHPERFLFKDDGGRFVLKHPDQLVVFSAGRRSCIGEQLARKETFLLFANIMRAFNVELREGATLPELKEQPGFIMYPPDFEAVFSRRHQSSTNN